MTYVVSDLNGHLDVFRDLLEKISFSEKRDVMYVLGDIVDYGPQPMELVQDLSTRINVYPIAGDRDYTAARLLTAYEKMLKTGERPADFAEEMADWIRDGGRTTMEEYRQLDDDDREGVLDYLTDMPLYEEVTVGGRDYLLLHRGIYDFTPNLDLDELEPEDFFSESPDPADTYFKDRITVVGHMPTAETQNTEPRIYRGNGIIFINCGLAQGGRLGCLRLEDGAEFYV